MQQRRSALFAAVEDGFAYISVMPNGHALYQVIAFLMPMICRFYGIIIQIYYEDQDPPHFQRLEPINANDSIRTNRPTGIGA
jgi:hypothetical protein